MTTETGPPAQMAEDEKRKPVRGLFGAVMALAASLSTRTLESMGELPPNEGFPEDDLPPVVNQAQFVSGKKVVFAPDTDEPPAFCRRCGGKPLLPKEDRDACRCRRPKGAP